MCCCGIALLQHFAAAASRTQAQAKKAQAATKKAVSTVKEVAHVQQVHVQQVLAKHKMPTFETSPSGRDRDRAATEGGPHPSDTPRPLLATLELLRRTTGEVRGSGVGQRFVVFGV
jgi:hypothetical protein